ncbi:relaxin receptor 1-like [Antechinus flavipes]|uniref:relaxin receptor 1-like n=1 Tax=Antechinus flavipes TaxID=38775 RepID=UPI002235C736|nr:relaxin receptor 1-like [Antechinus flavipes]
MAVSGGSQRRIPGPAFGCLLNNSLGKLPTLPLRAQVLQLSWLSPTTPSQKPALGLQSLWRTLGLALLPVEPEGFQGLYAMETTQGLERNQLQSPGSSVPQDCGALTVLSIRSFGLSDPCPAAGGGAQRGNPWLQPAISPSVHPSIHSPMRPSSSCGGGGSWLVLDTVCVLGGRAGPSVTEPKVEPQGEVLRGNAIKTIEDGAFAELPHLVELDLSSNQMAELPPTLYEGLQELQMLNISANPLKEIPLDHFDNLSHLQSLSMKGMEIPNIQSRMFQKLGNLSYIYFDHFQYCSYAPHVRSCQPNTDGISSLENLLANLLLRVFVWVIACATCLGNLFVVCMRTLIVPENFQHAMAIKCLCCADFLMGVYLFFIGASDLRYAGEYNKHAQAWMASPQCQAVGCLAMLSSEVSVLLLTYVTLEKYVGIVFPFSHYRAGRRQTLLTLVAIWLVGFTIAVVPFWSRGPFGNYYGSNGVCFPLHFDTPNNAMAQHYSTAIFLGVNLVAFITMVIAYSSMFHSVRVSRARSAKPSSFAREVSIAKRFFFIVFTDALCWLPIFLLKLLSLLHLEIPGTVTSWVVIFILPINSALNPVLYTITTTPFQEKLKQCLRRDGRPPASSRAAGPSFALVPLRARDRDLPELASQRTWRAELEIED